MLNRIIRLHYLMASRISRYSGCFCTHRIKMSIQVLIVWSGRKIWF